MTLINTKHVTYHTFYAFAVSPTQDSALAKIADFAKLKTGWHYGEGLVISEQVRRYAVALLIAAEGVGFTKTDAFPGANGEIALAIYKDDTYIEFTIEKELSITFYSEVDDNEEELLEGLTLDEAKQKIIEFGKRQWNLSGSSTEEPMTQPRKDLQAWPSKIQESLQESQLSVASALPTKGTGSVNISGNTIDWLQASPLSSGSSYPAHFPKVVA
jgi:hypothetical protein